MMREDDWHIGSIGKRGRKWVIGILTTDAGGRRIWRDWPWQYPTQREARKAFHQIPASAWNQCVPSVRRQSEEVKP